jgi:pyrroline-5-carboxylate reductase
MTYGIILVGAIGAAIVTGLCEGVQDAPSVVLCIRPQEAKSALAGLKFSSQQAVVSMMAGISITTLQQLVGLTRR